MTFATHQSTDGHHGANRRGTDRRDGSGRCAGRYVPSTEEIGDGYHGTDGLTTALGSEVCHCCESS
jgi:hypothetical protein